MGLLLLDREGAAVMEIKDRMLSGEALIDSFEGEMAVSESVALLVAVWERGSMQQVFLSMAGRSLFSNDLVLPVRSRTGKFKQGSISEWRQCLMNGFPKIVMMVSSDIGELELALVLKLRRKHSSMKAANCRNSVDSTACVLRVPQ